MVAAHLLHCQVPVVGLLLTSWSEWLQQEASAFLGVVHPLGHLVLDGDFRFTLWG